MAVWSVGGPDGRPASMHVFTSIIYFTGKVVSERLGDKIDCRATSSPVTHFYCFSSAVPVAF